MSSSAVTPPEVDVPIGRLPPRGPVLGSGGEAVVYELPGFTLPDMLGPLVYKQYLQARSRHGTLRQIVSLRSDLAHDPRRLAGLDSVATWPLRQVVDGDNALGVLMAKIPDEFFCTILKPKSGQRQRVPAEVQFVFVPPDRALRYEYPLPSPEQRLRICRDLARAMSIMHDELDVVFGDVNAKNEVIRLEDVPTGNPGAAPTVMLIDCDAVVPAGSAGQHPETPDWTVIPPEPMSRQSDLYKLGLFIVRCLKPADQPFYVRDPELAADSGVLDATGMDLLRAALGPPAARPTADRWVRHLSRLLRDATEPARLVAATLRKTVTVPGEPVFLDWEAADADVLTVAGAGCPPISVDATAGVGSIELRPITTGRFTVTVSNAMTGGDTQQTRPVAVLELLPSVDLPVPMPRVGTPRLDAVALPGIAGIYPVEPESVALPAVGDPTGWWTSALPAIVAPASEWSGPHVGDDAFGTAPDGPDLVPIMTSGPIWNDGPYVRGEAIR